MPKYGGPGRARQKCIKRQCLFLSRILQQEVAAEIKAGESGPAILQQELAKELGGGAVPGGLGGAMPERSQEGDESAESASDHKMYVTLDTMYITLDTVSSAVPAARLWSPRQFRRRGLLQRRGRHPGAEPRCPGSRRSQVIPKV